MSDLPEDTAAPESEAVAPSDENRTVSGLGAKDPKERAAALDEMHQAEQPLGDPVVDRARERNAEANRQSEIAGRFDHRKSTETITFGKGVPHVAK